MDTWETEFDATFDSRFYGNPKQVAMNPDDVKSFIRKVTARIAAQSEKKGREGVVDYIAVRLTQRAETPTNLYDIEVGKVKALYLSEALRIVEAARSSEEGKTV